MRFNTVFFLFVVLIVSCKAKEDTPKDLENELKKTMKDFLYNAINNDSTNVKYNIKDIIYYDDKERKIYVCQFTVNVKAKLFDTTGVMKANISKDFKKVDRLQ